MKYRNRKKNARRTLFFRMLTTYILLTLSTGTIVCLSSLVIFEHFHTESIHQSVRQNIANNHQSLADRVGDIKGDIIGKISMLQYGQVPQILNGGYIQNSYVSIRRIYDYLNQLVFENSPFVNSIHLYYGQSNVLISSRYGLKFLDSHGDGIETDWIDLMLAEDRGSIWIPARDIAFITSSAEPGQSSFSYATTYPVKQRPGEAVIMICIDFDEAYARERLSKNGKGINFILNGEGERLTNPSQSLSESITVRETAGREGYFLKSFAHVPYLVSYARDPVNQWIMLSLHPTDSLYRTMRIITWTIILIYAVTTISGILISYLLATRFYSPLKNLMSLIRIYDEGEENEGDGEFKKIGRIISGLGGHVHDLQESLDNSRTLLEAKLVRDLANKKGMKRGEIIERLRFLEISLDKSEFRFMKVDINYENAEKIQPSQAQIIKYRLINRISLLNDEQSSFIVTDYEDDSILVLINTEQNLEALKKTKLSALQSIESVYSADVFIRIFLTDPVNDIENLHGAYGQIRDMGRALFYIPSQQVLTSEVILPQTSEDTVDPALVLKFGQMLYAGSEDIFDEVDLILDQVIDRRYSLLEKQRVLIEMMNAIMRYMKDVSVDARQITGENIYGTFESFEDINSFRRWTMDVIDRIYREHSISLDRAGHDTIMKVKSYIENNIDYELSLSLVAEKVYLSPQYLSALFKKEEGINFIAYVQGRKMEKAKGLLIGTDMNVEEVGCHVGYHTSHYFIKKFKESTGLTPKQFRNRNLRLEPAAGRK